MTQTVQEPRELPLHMRRDGFDPVPEMAALREDEGVRLVTSSFGLPAWLVTRYADVREVLSDPARFSNSHVMSPGARPPGLPHVSPEEIERRRAGNLLALDPPEHTRLRRLLTPEFTVRRMRRLEPRIRGDRRRAPRRDGSGTARPSTWWRTSPCRCRRW